MPTSDPQSLGPDVAVYLDAGNNEQNRHRSLQDIAAKIQSGSSSINDLIEGLGHSLVSDDETERGRAALLLGEVVTLASASVNAQSTQEHLVQFLSSRLADWPSVHGCLKGIAGLISSEQGPPASKLLCPVVKALLNVHITTLAQADRMLALTILLQALQSCGTLLVRSGTDVISGVIAAIDGEKDPRCLLLSFQLSQQVVKIYEASPSVPAAQESLQADYEELFDVVACYFPISFTPPPNNVHGITREDLAGALQTTVTCTTLFTPLFIPMLVEKLSSTLRQAKLDALSALAAAAEAYRPDAMQPHLSAIWHALRGELLAPAAPGLLPTDLTSTQQIASKAAECLSKTAKALSQQGDEALAMKVLEDEQICGDLLACLSGTKQQQSHDPARHVDAITQAVAAVTGSSQAACGVEEDVRLLQLQVMTELVSLPVTLNCLSPQEWSSAVQQLLSCVARSSQSSQAVAQQAIVGLTRMAAAGHTDLLEEDALDALLEGATETSTAGRWQGMRRLTMASQTHDAESIQYQVQGSDESRQVSTSSVDIPSGDGTLPRSHSTQQLPGQCRDKGVLRGALQSVQAVMKEPAGRSKLEAEVTRLVATLTSLTSYQDADIRILGLQCLASVMELPYHLLHPLRKEVVAAVMLAVDDNMRRVRQQAVKCLGVWSNGL
ncbi:hypothetical protein WJX82_011614 [Trebouxia sp. C0006]